MAGNKITANGLKCRVYALIIAIDHYASPDISRRNLKGCINDANIFKAFLTDRLKVPDSQIMVLMNERATRSAILAAFYEHLTTNTQIDEGDAILVFYAGHGSRVLAPDGWAATDGKIETICPHDERMIDANGETIYGIPDRTINVMLRDLATKKGDNITAIFDCCHSGGITREARNKMPSVMRFIETLPIIKIPSFLDSSIWGNTQAETSDPEVRSLEVCTPAGFKHKCMASHVLLAACGQDQSAQEIMGTDGLWHGFFTNNLVKQLYQVDLDHATYADLLGLLPELIDQRPHCEGENKNRFLFNGKAVMENRSAFKLVEKKGTFEVQAGSVYGVSVGTEFAVQILDAALSPKSLGILITLSVNACSSILGYHPRNSKFDVPQGANAVVSYWKGDALTLRVAVELEAEDQLIRALFPERDLTQPEQVEWILNSRFTQVNARTNADVVVKRESARDKDLVFIERLDALIPQHASVTTMFDPSQLDHLPYTFDAIAQFNCHLMRHHADRDWSRLVYLSLKDMFTGRGYLMKRLEICLFIVMQCCWRISRPDMALR